MNAILIGVFVGLALGNFSYQVISGHDYGTALDRTFFQGVALFAVFIVQFIKEII